MVSDSLQVIRFAHVKAKADHCFTDGNYRDAIHLYTEAMDLCSDRAVMPKLLANRSAACLRAGRPQQALQDALDAVNLAPSYGKAHWRLACAYQALKKPLEAAEALAHYCSRGPAEAAGPHMRALAQTVGRLTTHELAHGILRVINNWQQSNSMQVDFTHAASDLQRIIAAAHLEQQQDEHLVNLVYSSAYRRWVLHGLSTAEALLLHAQLSSQQPRLAARLASAALQAVGCTPPPALFAGGDQPQSSAVAQHSAGAGDSPACAVPEWVALEAYAVLADSLDALQAPPAARAAARVLAANTATPQPSRLRLVRLQCDGNVTE